MYVLYALIRFMIAHELVVVTRWTYVAVVNKLETLLREKCEKQTIILRAVVFRYCGVIASSDFH